MMEPLEQFDLDEYGIPFDVPDDQYNHLYEHALGAKMKYQIGDNVEVVGNLAGHNQIGTRSEVTGYAGQFVRIKDSQYNFYEQDLKLLSCKKEKVIERCVKARNNYHLWQAKADYLERSNIEEFDNDAFRAYALKKLVENQNLSSDDKVTMISSIFSEE